MKYFQLQNALLRKSKWIHVFKTSTKTFGRLWDAKNILKFILQSLSTQIQVLMAVIPQGFTLNICKCRRCDKKNMLRIYHRNSTTVLSTEIYLVSISAYRLCQTRAGCHPMQLERTISGTHKSRSFLASLGTIIHLITIRWANAQ